jgi:PAS domain S-box-containing protein
MTAHAANPKRDAEMEDTRARLAESLPQATLDALSAHIAVLDEAGGIIAVNRAWRAFAEANPPLSSNVNEGANYLAVCDAAKGPDSEVAARVAAGIRAVIRGAESAFEMEYPCHSPDTKRWFLGRVSRFPGAGVSRVVVVHEDITAQKQAEHDLQASETRYRRLFESAKDGILILDADTGQIVDVNPFLIALLGYAHEDFVGKRLWEIGLFKDVAASKEAFTELQANGYVRYEDLPLETRDGRRIEVEFVSNVYPVNSTRVIQCNIRDITARMRLEKRRELTMQVLALLNRVNDVGQLVRDILRLLKADTGMEAVGIRLSEGDDFPYYETNGMPSHFVAAGRHLCARDAAGATLRDADGQPVLECMCGSVLRGRFDPSMPFFTSKGSFWTNSTTELLASTTDQDRLARPRNHCNIEGYESVALIPLRIGNDVIGLIQLNDHRKGMFTPEAIAFFEELGASIGIALARHRAREEREQMRAQLVQAQKLESIGTLAGGVAHEINNPIMGIMGYAQLILDQLGPESPVSEYATEIGKETERVATIVRNLLDFARLERETQCIPARLYDIVASALSLILAVMRHDQIAMEVDVPADLPQITCRSQQIQQVVMNLLTNARDALNQRYPGHDADKLVHIRARRIEKLVNSDRLAVAGARLSAEEARPNTDHRTPNTRPWLRLTVEDHGAGIPEDVCTRIFDPFFTTKPHNKGTGLGLTISHSIVKDHGGELSVESEVGQWTRFHVDFPVGDEPRDDRSP